jgi:hypothetical protein
MASTICCWATAFASINNLDLTAILGSLSGKTPDNLCKTVLMTELTLFKDSDTMLQSFKSLVQDLADSCSQHEVQRDVKVAKLVTSITNTMSDQGSINPTGLLRSIGRQCFSSSSY